MLTSGASGSNDGVTAVTFALFRKPSIINLQIVHLVGLFLTA